MEEGSLGLRGSALVAHLEEAMVKTILSDAPACSRVRLCDPSV
jgi:hypothetical protein